MAPPDQSAPKGAKLKKKSSLFKLKLFGGKKGSKETLECVTDDDVQHGHNDSSDSIQNQFSNNDNPLSGSATGSYHNLTPSGVLHDSEETATPFDYNLGSTDLLPDYGSTEEDDDDDDEDYDDNENESPFGTSIQKQFSEGDHRLFPDSSETPYFNLTPAGLVMDDVHIAPPIDHAVTVDFGSTGDTDSLNPYHNLNPEGAVLLSPSQGLPFQFPAPNGLEDDYSTDDVDESYDKSGLTDPVTKPPDGDDLIRRVSADRDKPLSQLNRVKSKRDLDCSDIIDYGSESEDAYDEDEDEEDEQDLSAGTIESLTAIAAQQGGYIDDYYLATPKTSIRVKDSQCERTEDHGAQETHSMQMVVDQKVDIGNQHDSPEKSEPDDDKEQEIPVNLLHQLSSFRSPQYKKGKVGRAGAVLASKKSQLSKMIDPSFEEGLTESSTDEVTLRVTSSQDDDDVHKQPQTAERDENEQSNAHLDSDYLQPPGEYVDAEQQSSDSSMALFHTEEAYLCVEPKEQIEAASTVEELDEGYPAVLPPPSTFAGNEEQNMIDAMMNNSAQTFSAALPLRHNIPLPLPKFLDSPTAVSPQPLRKVTSRSDDGLDVDENDDYVYHNQFLSNTDHQHDNESSADPIVDIESQIKQLAMTDNDQFDSPKSIIGEGAQDSLYADVSRLIRPSQRQAEQPPAVPLRDRPPPVVEEAIYEIPVPMAKQINVATIDLPEMQEDYVSFIDGKVYVPPPMFAGDIDMLDEQDKEEDLPSMPDGAQTLSRARIWNSDKSVGPPERPPRLILQEGRVYHESTDEMYVDPNSARNSVRRRDLLPERETVSLLEIVRKCKKFWLYKEFSRADAIDYLNDKQIGHFIIRESKTPGNYALTLRIATHGKMFWHGLLGQGHEGFRVEGSRPMKSLTNFLTHCIGDTEFRKLAKIPIPLVLPGYTHPLPVGKRADQARWGIDEGAGVFTVSRQDAENAFRLRKLSLDRGNRASSGVPSPFAGRKGSQA